MSNPYQAPESELAPDRGEDAGLGPVTAGMVAAVEGTRVWVILMAVMMALGVAGMLMGAAIMFFGGLGMAAVGGGEEGPFGGIMMAGLAFLYLLMAVLYAYPCWKLFQFAGAAGKVRSLGAEALEEALESQRLFWRFLGIMFLGLMGLYFVIFFVAMVAGMLGAAAGF